VGGGLVRVNGWEGLRAGVELDQQEEQPSAFYSILLL